MIRRYCIFSYFTYFQHLLQSSSHHDFNGFHQIVDKKWFSTATVVAATNHSQALEWFFFLFVLSTLWRKIQRFFIRLKSRFFLKKNIQFTSIIPSNEWFSLLDTYSSISSFVIRFSCSAVTVFTWNVNRMVSCDMCEVSEYFKYKFFDLWQTYANENSKTYAETEIHFRWRVPFAHTGSLFAYNIHGIYTHIARRSSFIVHRSSSAYSHMHS